MKTLMSYLIVIFLGMAMQSYAADKLLAPSHGIAYPEGWQDWATLAVSHRTDNNT